MADAAELLTSSGATGFFSVGVTSRAERRAQERTLDLIIRSLGGGEESSTLVLNCLPMGICIPTRLATVATPSVHLEMAAELLDRAGSASTASSSPPSRFPQGDRRDGAARQGPGFARPGGRLLRRRRVGGRELAPLRVRALRLRRGSDRAAGRAGVDGRRRGGPARAARDARPARGPPGALDSPSRAWRCSDRDPGYSPTLLTWDPNRLYMEGDGTTTGSAHWSSTALTRRLLPLVRYDLDDEADLLDAAAANRAPADVGQRRPARPPRRRPLGPPRRQPSVAGLEPASRDRQGGPLRHRRACGRADGPLPHRGGGGLPALHVQLRDGVRAGARHREGPAP